MADTPQFEFSAEEEKQMRADRRASFSDDNNWRMREMAGIPNPRVNRAPISPHFEQMPVSENIEDRRDDSRLPEIVQTLTGMYPEEWGEAMRHPLTPMRRNRNVVLEHARPIQVSPKGPDLESQLGLDDMDQYISAVKRK